MQIRSVTQQRKGTGIILVSSELVLALLAGEQGVNGSRKLLPALQELKLEDEDEIQEVTAHLLDQLARRVGRATCLAPR